jgi:hypothetical protein
MVTIQNGSLVDDLDNYTLLHGLAYLFSRSVVLIHDNRARPDVLSGEQ